MCVISSIVYLLVLGDLGSLDEFTLLIQKAGWKLKAPMVLLTTGILCLTVTFMCYGFLYFQLKESALVAACLAVFVFAGFYVTLLQFIHDYHMARHSVANGWRISRQRMATLRASDHPHPPSE